MRSDYEFNNFLFVDENQPFIQHVVTKRGGLVLFFFLWKNFKLISSYLISKIICWEKKTPRFWLSILTIPSVGRDVEKWRHAERLNYSPSKICFAKEIGI